MAFDVPEDESGTGAPPPGGPTPAQSPSEQQQGQQGGGGGGCPSGQVYRTDSQGAYGSGRPGCEPEDWRHTQDKDTCIGARPNCGKDYDAWCDFSSAQWKCGYIGGKQDPNEGDIRKDPKAGLQYNLRQGHATMVKGRNDLAYNVGKGNPNDSSTWSECWQVPSGKLVSCPGGLTPGGEQVSIGGAGYAGGAFPSSPYEQALEAQLSSLTQQFGEFSKSVFGTAFPAYKQGVDYYSRLLGKGGRGAMQAAVAPAAEQIAAGTEGNLRAIGSGYLAGGAKEQAEIAAKLQGQADTAHLTQGVQPGAASALVGAGAEGLPQALAGGNSAAGVLTNMANLSVQSRLQQEGIDLQRDLGFAGLDLEGQKLDLQRDLGYAGLDLSYAQLSQSAEQFRAQLGLQSSQFSQGMDWEKSKFAAGQQFDREGRLIDSSRFMQQQKQQKSALKAQMISGIMQGGAQTASAAITHSAAKFKEAITLAPAVLPSEALRRIAEEAAPALRAWRYKREFGGRAYDNALVLDYAPRYGLDPLDDAPGGQFVDLLSLLGDLVGAVRALRDENQVLRAQVEKLGVGGGV
jgi:hypothetical protein